MKIEFSKKELEKIHFLLKVAHKDLGIFAAKNFKKEEDKREYNSDIIYPIYEWETFFSNCSKMAKK